MARNTTPPLRSRLSRGARPWGALLLGVSLGIGGCDGLTSESAVGPIYSAAPAEQAKRTERFAVHPLHNPTKLVAIYQPLMDYLGAGVPGSSFELEASRDYGRYEAKIRARGPDFLLPNPWQTLEAMKAGYEVIAMAGEPSDFKGLFVVRKDSGIREIDQLLGKTLAYPSRTALAACLLPQWFLHVNGIDVNEDVTNRYVGSQESAIMNAYLGEAAVGVTWSPPWRVFQREHPAEAAQLRVAWETPPLINNSVMVRKDVPAELRERVRTRLLGLERAPEGPAILERMETARFLPGTDADYEVVREFVSRFEAEVRLVDEER